MSNTIKALETLIAATERAVVVLDMLADVEPEELGLARGIARRERRLLAEELRKTKAVMEGR